MNIYLLIGKEEYHIHQNSLISGVYYIKTFENSGDITFLNLMGILIYFTRLLILNLIIKILIITIL